MRNNVIIFGGSFNPIGWHHESIIRGAKIHIQMPVWVMPCYGHRFKNDNLISPDQRWEMVCLHCQENRVTAGKESVASPFEIVTQQNGSTYELVKSLRKHFPNYDFHVLIGADNAQTIDSWDQGLKLIKEVPFVVARNESIPEPFKWYLSKPHMSFFMEERSKQRSTSIRENIELGNYKEAEMACSPAVWNYIKCEGLYGYDKELQE